LSPEAGAPPAHSHAHQLWRRAHNAESSAVSFSAAASKGEAKRHFVEAVHEDERKATLARQNTGAVQLFQSESATSSKEEHDKVRARLASMESRTVNPNGTFMRRWDVLMIWAMIWTSTMTPFEIAFCDASDVYKPYPAVVEAWVRFACNRAIDLVFLVDIVLTFFVPFRESPKKGARWVYDSRTIAKRYLRSWFVLDVVSALPVDVINLTRGRDAPPDFSSKFLKFFRILKLGRLMRLSRVMKRLLSRSTVDPSFIELIKFALVTLAMAHWLACLWGFEGMNYSDNSPIDLDTWYVEAYETLTWVQKHQLTSATPAQLYGVALYVSLSNIFGGPTEISPANFLEFYLQCIMMFFGSSLWAYIISAGSSILASLTPAADNHRRTISMLNQYCRDHHVPSELSARLRSYFNETSRMRYFEQNAHELMLAMTSSLRGETSLATALTLFSRVPYLSHASLEAAFLSRAALALAPCLYCPREDVPSHKLTIVVRGLVARGGRCGISVFGDDMILNMPALRHVEKASALTLVQVHTLDRAVLDELLEVSEYPAARKVVRTARIKLTLRRVMLRIAHYARSAHSQKVELNLKEAFELARSGFESRVEEFTVQPPVEARIEQVDARVAALDQSLSTRMDALGGQLTQVLQHMHELSVVAHRPVRAKTAARKNVLNALPSAPSKDHPPPTQQQRVGAPARSRSSTPVPNMVPVGAPARSRSSTPVRVGEPARSSSTTSSTPVPHTPVHPISEEAACPPQTQSATPSRATDMCAGATVTVESGDSALEA